MRIMYNHINDFDFHLPKHLIAQYPLPERAASRMLTLNIHTGEIIHQRFIDLLSWVKAGDLIVFNNTKVFPARLFGRKSTGGQVECLVERVLSEQEVLAHLRFSKSPRPGMVIVFAEAFPAVVVERCGDLFRLRQEGENSWLHLLSQHGQIPLPLYIERSGEQEDISRYQTVYAQHSGAVAAPTAGLHFDLATLSALRAKGVASAEITLHIGAGTFQPVRVEQLDQHQMHSEYMQLPAETCAAIAACRQRGGKVIAVGTTVTRCLETAAAQPGGLAPFQGDTALFIRPGYQFQCVDALLTNFHLPKSTLLMLVAAFGGYEPVMHAYQAAITENYRFFSYGDAMLLLNTLS